MSRCEMRPGRVSAKRQTAKFVVGFIGLVVFNSTPSLGAQDRPAAPVQSEPRASEGDVLHVFFFGTKRPVLIRAHVILNQHSLESGWDDFTRDLFRYLDKNGDGVLSKEEAERLPTPRFLIDPNWLETGIRPALFRDMDANRDGKVTLSEFRTFLRVNGVVPFQMQFGAGRPGNSFANQADFSADEINDALFTRLDTNRDGKLSVAELENAAAKLLALDTNEDEMVSLRELVPYTSPGIVRKPTALGSLFERTGNFAFLVQTAGDPSARVTRRLVDLYGSRDEPAEQRKLTQKQIGLDTETFDFLDLDRDGFLDQLELSRITRVQPDLEITVKIGRDREGVEIAKADPFHGRGDCKVSMLSRGDNASLAMRGIDLFMMVTPGNPNRGNQGQIRSVWENQFVQADTDRNGWLDAKEAGQSSFFRFSFAMMDQKGDGKVDRKGMLEFVDKIYDFQVRAFSSSASLTVTEHGRGLFDLIDANHDGRLSVRELRNAPKLIARLDQNGDGLLGRDEIPRHILLSMSHGPGSQNQNFGFGPAFEPFPQPTTAGPLWFRKMDRNRDGDVSRREFLGTDEEFARIDTDGDGLISLEEAERFDRELRQRR